MFNLESLKILRSAEIAKVINFFRPGAHILEIGAGSGQQAAEIARLGFAVEAIEIASSNYRGVRIFSVTEYDGRHIPFPDASFDIVFSSNVLEHVGDLLQLNRETHRVLKPAGYCVHLMPTHGWRFWTTMSSIPVALEYLLSSGSKAEHVPAVNNLRSGGIGQRFRRHFGRHGERGNVLSELWLFHPACWRRVFRTSGFEIIHDEPAGIFYTGNMLFGKWLGVENRKALATIFGSACHIYVVRPVKPGH